MKFVSNSSPLVFLAKLDVLDFLDEHEIFVPEAVFSEILTKETLEKEKLQIFLGRKNIKIFPVQKKYELPSLGEGEKAVILLALERDIKDILIDERRGFALARLYNLRPKGTLWVILHAYKKGKIDKKQTKNLIYDLPGHGFYIDEQLLTGLLKKIDEF